MTSERIVIERRNTLSPRLNALAFTLLPASAGIWLLFGPGGTARTVLGVVAVIFSFFMIRMSLRFAGRIEVEGDQARVGSLWFGSPREIDLGKLVELHIRPLATRASDGGAPTLNPDTCRLTFADGERLFLPLVDFPGGERVLERAMGAPAEGFDFPVKLASACLVRWVRFVEDPRLGCSASYAIPGGTLSLFVYRGGAEDLPDGPDSEAVSAELDKACGDVRKLVQQAQPDPPREVERGLFGEGGPLPMREVTFAIGEATSRVYLTARGGCFLKGRFTGPAAAEPVVSASLAALAAHLGRGAEPPP